MENTTQIQETLITFFTFHVRLSASFKAKKAFPSLNPTEFHNPHTILTQGVLALCTSSMLGKQNGRRLMFRTCSQLTFSIVHASPWAAAYAEYLPDFAI
jgi:hypothetical protein